MGLIHPDRHDQAGERRNAGDNPDRRLQTEQVGDDAGNQAARRGFPAQPLALGLPEWRAAGPPVEVGAAT